MTTTRNSRSRRGAPHVCRGGPAVVTRALVTDLDGRWLLVLPVGPESPMWYLPGGAADRGEEPSAACARKLSTKTGLPLTEANLRVVAWTNPTQGHPTGRLDCLFDFGVHDVPPSSTRVALNRSEISQYRWCTPGEATNLLHPAQVALVLAHLRNDRYITLPTKFAEMDQARGLVDAQQARP